MGLRAEEIDRMQEAETRRRRALVQGLKRRALTLSMGTGLRVVTARCT